MPDRDALLAACDNVLPSYRPRLPLADALRALADALDPDDFGDVYGGGESLAAFEAEVAALLGKEAAVFLPSGIMAQQIALRLWCDSRRNPSVALHPSAHLEWAEHAGPLFLHGLQRLQFGAPELLRYRTLTAADFRALAFDPGAALIELPYRPLGGALPTWDELLAIRAWADERGVPLHLDGARLWQCRPFYGKSFAEIAALFDSVYVSFYKDIGGLCGAMLLGSAEFIARARVWQVRHGGRLYTQGPYWASAKVGMARVLPQIDGWVAKARAVAAALSAHPKVAINPDPPHTSHFQLFLHGDPATLNARHAEIAARTGTFLFFGVGPSPVPGVAMTEIHLGESSLAFDVTRVAAFLDELLAAD